MALRPVDSAVGWAMDTSGMWKGLCDRFVANVYGQSHSGYASAKAHWAAIPAKHRREGDKNPPVGSLVFWSGGQYGHVAVVTGKTRDGEPIITTTHVNGGRPTEMPLSQAAGLNYSGWATPYFQGKTPKMTAKGLDSTVAMIAADPEGEAAQAQGFDAANTTGLEMDTLDPKEAADVMGFSWKFVKAHPEVREVFETAVAEGWFQSGEVGKLKFQNAIQKTTWAQQNSTFAQQYILNKAKGGEVWEEQIRTAKEAVRITASNIGATLDDEQLDFFANQALMNGWNQPGRESFLSRALTGNLSYKDAKGRDRVFQTDYLNYESGAVSGNLQRLKDLAFKNGVEFTDDWYRGAVRSVAGGMSNINDHIAEIRRHAVSANPVFKDQIEAGKDVYDLASPYINRMAEVLELDPNTIKMNDPWIKQAMGRVDDKGNPIAMGLWDFEKSLRQDERWQYTKSAHRQVDAIVGRLGSMMGFGGSR